MPLPVTFATLSGGNQPLSDFDTQFAAVAALGAIPCSATGTNAITLTPNANTPTISSYVDLQPSFVFVAQSTTTGSVTIQVGSLTALNAYKWNGLQLCSAGDLIAGQIYRATSLQALNGGLGGFVVDTVGVNNNATDLEFIIDGGGSPITTGVKGFLHLRASFLIASWRVMADQSGSIVVDIFGAQNAVPTTSIVGGGNKPALSSVQFASASATGWTQTLLPTDFWIGYDVVSATTVTRVTVQMSINRQ